MPILTREDLQKQTRKRLLLAAQKEIVKKGVSEASIRDIAKAAGYTMGAFYSNFASKGAILEELIAVHMREEILVFKEITTNAARGKEEDTWKAISDWLKEMRKNKNISALGFELQMYANRNTLFRKKFDSAKAQRLKELADGLGALFSVHGLKPKIDCFQVAVSLAALWDGFFIHRTVPGAMPDDQLILFFLKALLDDSVPIRGAKQKNINLGGSHGA